VHNPTQQTHVLDRGSETANVDDRQIKAQYQLQTCLAECGLHSPHGLRVLEFGFRNGLFLRACRDAGLHPTGLEIEKQYYDRVSRGHPDLDLILYDGLNVPLPDESCDLIVSFQVLEHVASLATTLDECVRLLKPGGIMYHVLPNYRSFYEGHYRVLWWPFLNRAAGRVWLKILRKHTPYYETLNIVKPADVRRAMHKHRRTIEIISLGRKEFLDRFSAEQIAKVQQKHLRTLLTALLRLGPLKSPLIKTIAACDLYYPITLIVRKTPHPQN
jgi:SAM-dependent methyltransferase